MRGIRLRCSITIRMTPKKAIDAFEKVLSIDPSDPDTLYMLGTSQLEARDFPAAVAEFQKALQIDPQHASSQYGLARALQREGKAEEARVALQRFQAITSAKLGFPLSHIYGEEGKYAHVEDAATCRPQGCSNDPRSLRRSMAFCCAGCPRRDCIVNTRRSMSHRPAQ